MDMAEGRLDETERRFLISRMEAAQFLKRAQPRLTLDVHDRDRPVAYTRTTYLDTADRVCLRSCDTARVRRVRIREYAAAADLKAAPQFTGLCFLELKENTGAARYKVRVPVEPLTLWEALRRDELTAVTGTGLLRLERILAGERVAPCVATWYRRVSFSSDDGVRITLDDTIEFCRPQGLARAGELAGPRQVVARAPGRVLELKYVGTSPAWLAEATTGLREALSFSKFREGMIALDARESGRPTAGSTTPLEIPPLAMRTSE